MAHTCHANHCNAPCRPEHLMCARHWAMVPRSAQDDVLRHYQRGQCNGTPVPTKEWFDAAHLAIAHVAKLEGKPMSRRQANLLRSEAA